MPTDVKKTLTEQLGEIMTSTIAYVDGYNLYYGLRAKYRHRYLWLDVEQLVRGLRPKDDILAIRYFTALAISNPSISAHQQNYLAALKAHSGSMLEIIYGRYQAITQTCHSCGTSWQLYEEKETDVNIAVSLVADAVTKASDLALIISADSDLCPGIRMARTLNPTRGIIAAFPPRRASKEIRTLIPGAFTIAAVDLRNSLLPTSVADPVNGTKYTSPTNPRLR